MVEMRETLSGQDTQTSESLGIALVCQMKLAETLEMVEFGTLLSAESVSPMRVTTSVVEAHLLVVEHVEPHSVVECAAPKPAVSYAALALVVEYIALAPAVFHAEQASYDDYSAPAPDVSYTALALVVSHSAPALAVSRASPVPAVEYIGLALA